MTTLHLRSIRGLPRHVFAASVFLAAWATAAGAAPAASAMPADLHGAWSTRLEYCGQDSDGNYFLSERRIDAWEVAWQELRLRSASGKAIRLSARHVEYEDETPVALRIERTSADTISFEECTGASCWNVALQRCPKTDDRPGSD